MQSYIFLAIYYYITYVWLLLSIYSDSTWLYTYAEL